MGASTPDIARFGFEDRRFGTGVCVRAWAAMVTTMAASPAPVAQTTSAHHFDKIVVNIHPCDWDRPLEAIPGWLSL